MKSNETKKFKLESDSQFEKEISRKREKKREGEKEEKNYSMKNKTISVRNCCFSTDYSSVIVRKKLIRNL